MMRWPGEVLRMWMACCLERPGPAPFMSWCPGVRGGGEPLRGFQALQRRQALGHGVLLVPRAPLSAAEAPTQGRRLVASDNMQSLLTHKRIRTST